MNKNRKGFMLAELIITATVIIGAMVGLYASYNRIYSLYKKRNNYYHVDGVYATKEMTNHYMKDNFNKIINDNLEKRKETETTNYYEMKYYFYIIKDGKCIDETDETCQAIKDLYQVENMLLVEYDICTLKPSAEECKSMSQEREEEIVRENPDDSTVITEIIKIKIAPIEIKNETFKEYIDYLIKYYNIKEENDYSYIVLTEINKDGNMYYSNLRIR